MISCTFFGHRDCPNEIEHPLHLALIDLIKNKNVDLFYVGNHGHFDYIVRKSLQSIKADYPHINFYVVLAYMPGKNQKEDYHCHSIYPAEVADKPRKYAIDERNKWMISKSNYVVSYVKYTFGGAYTYRKLAEKKRKIIVDL